MVEGAINAQNISNSQLNTDLKNIAKTLTLEIDKMLFGQNVDMGESIVSFFNGYIDLMNKYPELNNSDIRLILEQAIIVAESDGFDVALLNEILTQDDIKNAIVSIVKSGFNCSDRTAEKLTADLISFVTCEQTYNILLKDFLVEIGYKNDIISSISNVFLNAINCPPIEQYINIVNQNFSSDLYSMFIVNDNNFSMQNFSIEKIIKNAYKTLDALHYGYNQNLKNIVLILADESLTATFEERISLILSDDSFKNLTFELLEQIYQREITEAEQTEILSLIQDVVNYTNGQETLENVKTAFVDYLKVYFPSLPAEQVEELINQAIEHVLNVYNAISSQNWVELEASINNMFTWLENNDVIVPAYIKTVTDMVLTTHLEQSQVVAWLLDNLHADLYVQEIFCIINQTYAFTSEDITIVSNNFALPVIEMIKKGNIDVDSVFECYLTTVEQFTGMADTRINKLIKYVKENNSTLLSLDKLVDNVNGFLQIFDVSLSPLGEEWLTILADTSKSMEQKLFDIFACDSTTNLVFDILEQIYQREIIEAEQTEILSLIQDVVNYTNGQETLENVKTAFVDYLKVYFPSLPAEQVEELINQAIEHVLNVYNAISSQNWVELETRVNDVFTWLESRDVVVPQEVKSIANYVITQLKSGTIENFVFDVLEQIYQREIPTTERTEISSIIQGIVSYANGQTSLLEVATTVKDYLKVYFPSLQIEQVEDLITQGIEHVSEIYEAVCSKVFENIKSSLQSTIEWLEDLGVKISDTITNLLRTKELLVKELALLSNASTEAQLQEVEQKLNNIIEQVSNKQFAQALSSVESLLDSYYSEKSQTIFKSILTIYIVATNSLEDLDLNELFSFIELPEGVSIDYNKLYNKIKSTLTNSNIISIESAKTERVVVDDNNSYTKLVLIVNINVDVEIASISGSVKVEIN